MKDERLTEKAWVIDYPVELERCSIDRDGERMVWVDDEGWMVMGINEKELFTMEEWLGRKIKSSNWGIDGIQWNPTLKQKNWLALWSHQRMVIYEVHEKTYQVNIVFQWWDYNQRILDMDWNRCDGNILATVGMEGEIHVYNLARGIKPSHTYTLDSGYANRIRWFPKDPFRFVTTHDAILRFWTCENQITSYMMHDTSITLVNCIEWDLHSKENRLLLAGSKKAIEIITVQETTCESYLIILKYHVIKTLFLSWSGILGCAMANHEEPFLIYTLENISNPCNVQLPHAIVKDFTFHKVVVGNQSFCHLSLWCDDKKLRLLTVYPGDFSIHSGKSANQLDLRNLIAYPGFSRLSLTIRNELYTLNLNLQAAAVEQICDTSRSCIVRLKDHELPCIIRFHFAFPPMYPYKVIPKMTIFPFYALTSSLEASLQLSFGEYATECVLKNLPCIECCLSKLLIILKNIAKSDPVQSMNKHQELVHSLILDRIPTPRTCSAVYAGNDRLVWFFVPKKSSISRNSLPQNKNNLPESQSDLDYEPSDALTHGSLDKLKMYFDHNDKVGSKSLKDKYNYDEVSESNDDSTKADPNDTLKILNSIVQILDVSAFESITRSMAMNYRLIGDSPSQVCYHNAKVALAAGRADLHRTWSIAGIIMDKLTKDYFDDKVTYFPVYKSSYYFSFGKQIVVSLLKHYLQLKDISTLAMLSILLSSEYRFWCELDPSRRLQLVPRSASLSGKRSYSEVVSKNLPGGSPLLASAQTLSRTEVFLSDEWFLDSKSEALYNYWKKFYAEMLARWGLLQKRTEVFRFVNEASASHLGIGFETTCSFCHRFFKGSKCRFCNVIGLSCSICRLSIRGRTRFCLQCGHGGHWDHIQYWFDQKTRSCPTGCGCICSSTEIGVN